MQHRKFTSKNCILLTTLVCVLLGIAYYFLVHRQVEDRLMEARTRSETAVASCQIESARALKKQHMLEEIDTAKASDAKQLPEYDNSVGVIAYLNQVMAATSKYSLSFGRVEQGNYVALRTISMDFTCQNYKAVKDIVAQLEDGPYFCEVIGLSMQSPRDTGDVTDGTVSVRMTAVFYEYTGEVSNESDLQEAEE